MNKKIRELFTDALESIQQLNLLSSSDSDADILSSHIILDMQNLADIFNADQGEFMALLHNAQSKVIQGWLVVDVDKYIEDFKLLNMLYDVKIEL